MRSLCLGLGVLMACRAPPAGSDPTGPETGPAPSITPAPAAVAPAIANAIPTSVPTLEATAVGKPYDLQAGGDAVSFCDDRGARRMTVSGSGDVATDRPCERRERPADCGLEARTPGLGPDDIVDLPGSPRSFPIVGHAGECAAHDHVVVLATGERVLLLFAKTGRSQVVARDFADAVALGDDWVAWTSGHDVHARRRAGEDAPVAVPASVTYVPVHECGIRVEVPSFFEETSTPRGGSWTGAWEGATLDVLDDAIEPGETAATMCDGVAGGWEGGVEQVTTSGCFVTGKRMGTVYWEREQYREGRRFSLELEYDETLRVAFDPIVRHISASFRVEPHDGGCP